MLKFTVYRRGLLQVAEQGWYLFVLQVEGYYDGYVEAWVGAVGIEVSLDMVQVMGEGEDRIVLRWGHTQDLDLWAYDARDYSSFVSWELDDPRSARIAGGLVTLDVDNQAGHDGPETTKLEGVSSGTIEVWVNHYSDVFTAEEAREYPATVEIFCERCVDEAGAVLEGLVVSVRQEAADVIAGASWWKVGQFVAPAPSDDTERVEWQTCRGSQCYVSEELAVSVVAHDMLTHTQLTGVQALIYSDYPDDFSGCSADGSCGTMVSSASDSAAGQVEELDFLNFF